MLFVLISYVFLSQLSACVYVCVCFVCQIGYRTKVTLIAWLFPTYWLMYCDLGALINYLLLYNVVSVISESVWTNVSMATHLFNECSPNLLVQRLWGVQKFYTFRKKHIQNINFPIIYWLFTTQINTEWYSKLLGFEITGPML